MSEVEDDSLECKKIQRATKKIKRKLQQRKAKHTDDSGTSDDNNKRRRLPRFITQMKSNNTRCYVLGKQVQKSTSS